ncbi:hypothetical protein ACWD69_12755 [Micromonospora chokoriensis]
MAPFAAVVVYVHGLWADHFFDLRAASEYCPANPGAPTSTSDGWLPLRHVCRYADGATADLVPAYINPVVFLCLATAAACTALALRSARRPARAALAPSDHPR